ncbi:MAG TPA: hypothetical protein VGM94_19285 [Galbitalea sp.]|jgi:hypothetical protein
MAVATAIRADVHDWRTWTSILLRACLYTLPFLLVTIRLGGVELGGFGFFPVLVPVAAYRVLTGHPRRAGFHT